MDRRIASRNTSAAILAMCAGVLSLVVNDAMAKALVARFDPLQILFMRSVIALPVVAALALSLHGASGLRTGGIGVHVFRGALSVGATYLFIHSLGALALAEATALIFTAPLFIAALSVPLLGQPLSRARGLAVAAGFVGALMIVQPGAATLSSPALWAVSAALLYALVMMSARWIDAGERFWTMTLYMTAISGCFGAVGVAFVADEWPPVTTGDMASFAGMAFAGTMGVALISQAFRMADATLVAPFDYTALIWATLLGWLLWGDVPGPPVWLGAAIIVGSGVYLIVTEKKRAA